MAPDFRKVLAFEPVTEHLECLKLNTAQFDNVRVRPVALGAQKGPAKLHVIGKNSGASYIDKSGAEKPHRKTIQTLNVQVAKLDDFDDLDEMAFLKIDVQGFEADVLLGGKRTIKALKPVILIEQTGLNTNGARDGNLDALSILKGWGMKKAESWAGDHVMIW